MSTLLRFIRETMHLVAVMIRGVPQEETSMAGSATAASEAAREIGTGNASDQAKVTAARSCVLEYLLPLALLATLAGGVIGAEITAPTGALWGAGAGLLGAAVLLLTLFRMYASQDT